MKRAYERRRQEGFSEARASCPRLEYVVSLVRPLYAVNDEDLGGRLSRFELQGVVPGEFALMPRLVFRINRDSVSSNDRI
jgi:hypothetical protein